MRIGIDARFFGPIGKGLGRYTQKLIENLEKIDSKNQYFIFLTKENFGDYRPAKKNFKKVLADCRWYTLKEQLEMPLILNKYELDLVHFPHFNIPFFYRKKFIVTIHDLILIHYPTTKGTTLNSFFYWLKFLAYKIIIFSAIRRSGRVITVSNFTKNDILKNYKINPEKISVTYEACEDFCNISFKNIDEILLEYGIIKPYILYVGNAYPHKNLENLIDEFSQMNVRMGDYQLVLVGKEDYFYRRLQKLVEQRKNKNIIFPGYIPDRDLDVVYREAKLYIFPSYYEGFGLPPLEAMAKGVPVITSDHPCMKEILGESAYYFDAKKDGEIGKSIIEVLTDNKLMEQLKSAGYAQSKKFSWEKMAQKTLEIYNQNAH